MTTIKNTEEDLDRGTELDLPPFKHLLPANVEGSEVTICGDGKMTKHKDDTPVHQNAGVEGETGT